MTLDNEVEDENPWKNLIKPEGLNRRELGLYWTAQLNACILPFSFAYAVLTQSDRSAWVAMSNLVLTYGSILCMTQSYNKRNKKTPMVADWSPSVSFAGKRYRAEEIINLRKGEE
jgi:hypothetical protein